MHDFTFCGKLFITLCLGFLLVGTTATVSARTVRAGLEQNPPLSFIDESGDPAGLLVDLLNGIARKEGWTIEYTPDTFKNCLEKLEADEIDLMITIAWSEERAKRYDFNQIAVIALWGALYTPLDLKVESYFDLEGKKIAVMRRDIHYQALRTMLQNFGINPVYIEVDDFNAVFTQLRDKKAEAGVVGRFYALDKEEEYGVHASPMIFNPIRVHYATAKGVNQELLLTIDQNLNALKRDPSSLYYQARERWLDVVSKKGWPGWITPLFLGITVLIMILAIFLLFLRREVKIRTLKLENEIAKRAQTVKALRKSEQNYRELVENANAIILSSNLQGEITFINDFGERFFGYQKEELIGKKLLETIVPETQTDGTNLAALIEKIIRSPDEHPININENSRKDGTRVWVFWHNRTVFDDKGQPCGNLSVGQDITEQIKAEQKQLQLDRAKDDFIATAAHELRTPLTSIIGYAELLRDNAEDGLSFQQQHEFHSEICNKGFFLSRIIDDMLDISRIQEGTPLPLYRTENDLADLVIKIFNQYQTLNPEHDFLLTINADNRPKLLFDADRITQVLENLLSNAIRYSSPGSRVSATVDVVEGGGRVVIADQGIGMNSDEVEQIFENFYRADKSNTSIGGLGLGMSIVKKIIESHGGTIDVASTPGQGTRITFTLPADSAVIK